MLKQSSGVASGRNSFAYLSLLRQLLLLSVSTTAAWSKSKPNMCYLLCICLLHDTQWARDGLRYPTYISSNVIFSKQFQTTRASDTQLAAAKWLKKETQYNLVANVQQSVGTITNSIKLTANADIRNQIYHLIGKSAVVRLQVQIPL